MRELKLSVPTYYGRAYVKQNVLADTDFDVPNVPVLIHEAEGIRVVLGTHDFDDMEKPDIQIERRPQGWAIFLHPVGGNDASGYVYFLDDGRSFLLREQEWSREGSIEILHGSEGPPEIDEIDLPRSQIRTSSSHGTPDINSTLDGSSVQRTPDMSRNCARRQKTCARCRSSADGSDDWYGELCPVCADQTDGEWACRSCGRRGTFEDMGGDGANDPVCCGNGCQRVDAGEPFDDEEASA